MSDQPGRHDATGPLARGADGRVDPDGYVRFATQGREALLLRSLLLVGYGLLLLLRGFGMQEGMIVLAALIAADLAIVATIRGSQWWTERARRRAGQPPSWSAQLFVLQARTQGFDLLRAVRSDSRMAGVWWTAAITGLGPLASWASDGPSGRLS